MSGIYIKGMEMPKCCYDCNFCRHYDEPNQGYFCIVLLADLHRKPITEERVKNCPLVPVPEHGDLIDRSQAVVEEDTYYQCYNIIAPTIIPADEGSE